jgi:DNA-binding SARP family transcriptional activator
MWPSNSGFPPPNEPRDYLIEKTEAIRTTEKLRRGPPLADFAYEAFAQSEIARLEELRLVAFEELFGLELASGQSRELVPELERLTNEHPFRERLRGELMIALYRGGLQADALEGTAHGAVCSTRSWVSIPVRNSAHLSGRS